MGCGSHFLFCQRTNAVLGGLMLSFQKTLLLRKMGYALVLILRVLRDFRTAVFLVLQVAAQPALRCRFSLVVGWIILLIFHRRSEVYRYRSHFCCLQSQVPLSCSDFSFGRSPFLSRGKLGFEAVCVLPYRTVWWFGVCFMVRLEDCVVLFVVTVLLIRRAACPRAHLQAACL